MSSSTNTAEWKPLIEPGDKVIVYLPGDFQGSIFGTVRSMAQATGECWVIESDRGIHYVQNFMEIRKERPPTGEIPF